MRNLFPLFLSITALGAFLVTATPPLAAQENPMAVIGDESVRAEVSRIEQFYQSLQSYRVEGEWIDGKERGTFQFATASPDKFAFYAFKDGKPHQAVVMNGTKLTVYNAGSYSITESTLPAEAILAGANKEIWKSPGIFIGRLLGKGSLTHTVMPYEAEELGSHEIDGIGYQTIRLSYSPELPIAQPAILTYQSGDQPLIKQYSTNLVHVREETMVYKSVPDGLKKERAKYFDQRSIEFNNWQLNVELPDAFFEFTPPPGSKKVQP